MGQLEEVVVAADTVAVILHRNEVLMEADHIEVQVAAAHIFRSTNLSAYLTISVLLQIQQEVVDRTLQQPQDHTCKKQKIYLCLKDEIN